MEGTAGLIALCSAVQPILVAFVTTVAKRPDAPPQGVDMTVIEGPGFGERQCVSVVMTSGADSEALLQAAGDALENAPAFQLACQKLLRTVGGRGSSEVGNLQKRLLLRSREPTNPHRSDSSL